MVARAPDPDRPAPARHADEPDRRAGDRARAGCCESGARRAIAELEAGRRRASSGWSADLQDEIMPARMVPVGEVFDRFPRLVRDWRRDRRQADRVRDRGQEIELDRVDARRDRRSARAPAAQRRSITASRRPDDARRAPGSRRAGRLIAGAVRDRAAVAIRVSDDGRGIDRERVLAKAQRDGARGRRRWTTLSDDELLQLLARPGSPRRAR